MCSITAWRLEPLSLSAASVTLPPPTHLHIVFQYPFKSCGLSFVCLFGVSLESTLHHRISLHLQWCPENTSTATLCHAALLEVTVHFIKKKKMILKLHLYFPCSLICLTIREHICVNTVYPCYVCKYWGQRIVFVDSPFGSFYMTLGLGTGSDSMVYMKTAKLKIPSSGIAIIISTVIPKTLGDWKSRPLKQKKNLTSCIKKWLLLDQQWAELKWQLKHKFKHMSTTTTTKKKMFI